MSAENDLLARELAKLAATWAKRSGVIGGGVGEAVVGAVGGLAMGLTTRFLPTERCQRELTLYGEPRAVLARAYGFLASKGRVVDSEEVRQSPYPAVSGVLGSGFLNMNPAVVHAEIVDVEEETCRVLLSGAAKEGLIKQRTAEKAVGRLAEALERGGTAKEE